MEKVSTAEAAGKEISIEEVQRQAKNHQESQNQGTRVQLISFKLGAGEYALNIDQIKEVVLTPPIAKVPQTPSYIKGIANIRGSIIAIIDLEEKFGLSEESNTTGAHGQYTLVIESEEHKVGILVKDVPNTLSVFTQNIEDSSNVIQFSSLDQDCVEGIVKVDHRMIILVDMHQMIRQQDFGKAAQVIN